MAKDKQILIRVSREQYEKYKEFAEEFTEGNMSRAFRRCLEIAMETQRNQDDQHQDLGSLESSLDAIYELLQITERKVSVMSMRSDSNGIDSSVLETTRKILDRLRGMENPTYLQLFEGLEQRPDVFEAAVSLLEALGWEIRRDDPNDYEGGGEADDQKCER